MKDVSRVLVVAVAVSMATGVYAAEKVSPQVKMERDISDQRGQAIRGGYERDLDRAIETYGGSRTKEVIHESERIRHGGGQGSGHNGDTVQPGLTGREGMR